LTGIFLFPVEELPVPGNDLIVIEMHGDEPEKIPVMLALLLCEAII
jgi:hypothetical protein